MKRLVLILIVILCLLLTGCGGKEKLKLKSEAETIIQEIDYLNEKLDYRLNGARNLILEAREAYNTNNEDELLKIAGKLHTNFKDSPEDIEAQQYISPIVEDKESEINRIKEVENEKHELSKKTREEKLKKTKKVNAVYPCDMDYYGGTDLIVNFVNNSDKTIKYVTFYCQPFNAVGDPVSCKIQYESAFSMNHLSEGAFKSTGPYAKGEGVQGKQSRWAKAWYNSTIKTVKLNKVEIEYMNGSKEIIDNEKDIDFIMNQS